MLVRPLSQCTVGIRNPTIRKPDSFENRTKKRPVFEWLTIRKPDGHSKTGRFVSGFRMAFKNRMFYHSKTRRFCPVFEW